MENDKKPWYKKKRYLALLFLIGLVILSGDNSDNQVKSTSSVAPVSTYNTVSSPLPANIVNSVKPTVVHKTTTNTNPLSNNNYYTNVSGNTVHSPAYSNNNSIPSGASARCRDGTYSFSQHRSGTCSHHGGVSEWL